MNKHDDQYDPPTIIKMDAKQNGMPKSAKGTLLSKILQTPRIWTREDVTTTGDYAIRAPPPPEPPPMVSENSGDHPSMVDDLDAGESEGRTKMAFAKMQTPLELRESYVFEDHDFEVNQEEESIAASSEQDELQSQNNRGGGMDDTQELFFEETNAAPSDEKKEEESKSSNHFNNYSLQHKKNMKVDHSPRAQEKKKTEIFTVGEKAAQLGLYS